MNIMATLQKTTRLIQLGALISALGVCEACASYRSIATTREPITQVSIAANSGVDPIVLAQAFEQALSPALNIPSETPPLCDVVLDEMVTNSAANIQATARCVTLGIDAQGSSWVQASTESFSDIIQLRTAVSIEALKLAANRTLQRYEHGQEEKD